MKISYPSSGSPNILQYSSADIFNMLRFTENGCFFIGEILYKLFSKNET